MFSIDEQDRLLNVVEVSEILHVHPNTLRRWSDQGIIEAYRFGPRRDRKFKQQDITRFVTEYNPYI